MERRKLPHGRLHYFRQHARSGGGPFRISKMCDLFGRDLLIGLVQRSTD
jgi:hypothetical protein